jgi:hypothetical protein
MKNFPFPAEPSEKQNRIEESIGRWLVVALPVILLGHLLGAFAIVAALMSANWNIFNWVE